MRTSFAKQMLVRIAARSWLMYEMQRKSAPTVVSQLHGYWSFLNPFLFIQLSIVRVASAPSTLFIDTSYSHWAKHESVSNSFTPFLYQRPVAHEDNKKYIGSIINTFFIFNPLNSECLFTNCYQQIPTAYAVAI